IGRQTDLQSLPLAQGFAGLTTDQQQLLAGATVGDVIGVTHALYRYVGSTGQVSLASPDFTTTSLWQRVNADFTTSGNTGTISITNGKLVLVQHKIGYGLYKYVGAATSLDLNQQDYGNTARWQPVIVTHSSGDAAATLSNGDLVQDLSTVDDVTLQ